MKVVGTVSVQESFDALPMDGALPEPWTLAGVANARIVALPTSVDRSARLSSGLDAAPTTACLPVVSTAAVSIAFDYILGRALPAPAIVLTVQAGDANVAGVVLDRSAAPVAAVFGDDPLPSGAKPDASLATLGSPQPEGWQRLDVSIDRAAGSITWRAHDVTGARTGEGTATSSELSTVPIDTVCFHSPDGAPSGWVAIDDVDIRG